MEINLQNTLDLSDNEKLKSNNIFDSFLFEDWNTFNELFKIKAYSQEIGNLVFKKGYEAILVQSAVNRSKNNLIIFTDNLLINSYIKLKEKHEHIVIPGNDVIYGLRVKI